VSQSGTTERRAFPNPFTGLLEKASTGNCKY